MGKSTIEHLCVRSFSRKAPHKHKQGQVVFVVTLIQLTAPILLVYRWRYIMITGTTLNSSKGLCVCLQFQISVYSSPQFQHDGCYWTLYTTELQPTMAYSDRISQKHLCRLPKKGKPFTNHYNFFKALSLNVEGIQKGSAVGNAGASQFLMQSMRHNHKEKNKRARLSKTVPSYKTIEKKKNPSIQQIQV